MAATPKRNVRVDDDLWARLERAAALHERDASAELRVALDIYTDLVDNDPKVGQAVILRGSGS